MKNWLHSADTLKQTALVFLSSVLILSVNAQRNVIAQNGQPVTTSLGLFDNSSFFTFEFWVRTAEIRGSNTYWQRPCLFGNITQGNNSGDFGINISNGYIGMWEGLSSSNTDQYFLSQNVRINDNQWHHIAAVNNGREISLYVDGNLLTSLSSGKRLITNKAPLTFGAASLDYSLPGNSPINTNFPAGVTFGKVRLSNAVRYSSNFIPPQDFVQDGETLALYDFSNQNKYTSYNDNDRMDNSHDAELYSNYDKAQPAVLYLNDASVLNGRLLLDRKNFGLNEDVSIIFFEENSRKGKYFNPDEIKGFRLNNDYFEPKFLSPSGMATPPLKKTMVKRLTPMDGNMAMYEYENHTSTKNAQGIVEYQTTKVYFIQLPNTTDNKIYQFTDNKFSPRFDEKVSAIVQDKPALSDKIRRKDKNYFYAAFSEDSHRLQVWRNIINEYNQSQ